MASPWSDADLGTMRQALELALRGYPTPNPHVGCVLVKGGQVVGQGFHEYATGPHAEAVALDQAGDAARGATAYVTLEPCSHRGRTPPCADAFVKAGVSRVVVAMQDPNPHINGSGIRRMKEAGIKVSVGLLRGEAEQINPHFLKFHRTGRPWVTIKAALSMDGKIATRAGDSKWIANERAREEAHRLRAEHGAVLVGRGTVAADDPLLTARIPGVHNQPIRVVLDTHLLSDPKSKIYNGDASTIIYCVQPKEDAVRRFEDKGVRVAQLAGDKERVDISAVLADLAEQGVTGVLVEGGGAIIGSFVDAKLVDSACFFFAPILIGGKEAVSAVEADGAATIADAMKLENVSIKWFDDCWMVEGRVQCLPD